MKKIVLSLLAVMSVAACSTNADGSINWADNPVERVASRLNAGIQGANAGIDTATGQKQGVINDELGVHNSGIGYKTMLNIGYIKRNPEYPKHSTQRWVFTSVNCSSGRRCYMPDENIAPRP